MLKKIQGLGLLLTAALMAGCSSVSVYSDFDGGADFNTYRTFSFISDRPLLVAGGTSVSPLLGERLMRATRAELAARGMRFTEDRENSDVVVSFTLGARDKIQVTSYPQGYRGGWHRGWGSRYYNEVDVRNYVEGTLAIDLFDTASKKPIWHGWAVKSITAADRESPEVLIKEIVSSILAQYPPGAAS